VREKVAVLGEGAWGSAVATLLAENGHTVALWCHNAELATIIAKTGKNDRYLPGITLDTNRIKPTSSINEAVCGVTWVFEAIPVKYLRSVVQEAHHCFSHEQTWVILSKGIEQETLLLPSQIVDDVFGESVNKAVISGPSFAYDLAQKMVTGVTIAAIDCASGLALQKLLANSYFRPYVTLDVLGTQVGGAVKNVIALGVGMLDGAGFTDNAQAFLLTRGLHEMVELAHVLGGKTETLYGLSGVGDMVLTSMGGRSRNLEVGRRLGKGHTLETILRETGYIPEGINTVVSVAQLIERHNLNLPICRGVHQVIFGGWTPQQLLENLMSHPLEQECLY
jgi:glycerol-3-phosphate dehydrogenase (NAD(P)+)